MGGRNVTTYIENGEEYNVIVEGERERQQSFSDIESIQVRSSRTGQLIPLSNLVELREFGAAETLSRYNRIRAITLDANLSHGRRVARLVYFWRHAEYLFANRAYYAGRASR